jgi:flavin-dependent dehydrogenase
MGTRYDGRKEGAHLLVGRDGPRRVRARFVVGGDGARSRVARDLGLDRNRHLLVGAEEVFEIPGSDEPRRSTACSTPRSRPDTWRGWSTTGATPMSAWRATRIAFPTACAGLSSGSAPGLPAGRPDDVEKRGGPIPVGGLLRRISCTDGLLVGDAAGALSPLTAGGLDPCLRLSDLAADVLDEALRAGRPDALSHYDGATPRAHFRGRLLLRRALTQVRTPTVAKASFPLLRTPLGRAAARRILFGDRSFPAPR